MLISKKFSVDLVWNFISLFFVASCGIFINFFIAKFYGAKYLGVFNQVLAFYLLSSQFSSGGIQFSVLKHISHNQSDIKTISYIVSSAVVLVLCISLCFSIVTYLLKDSIGNLLDSMDVGFGLSLISPGLIFFSLNKILLNVLNGMNLMKPYALFQSSRYILILLFIVCIHIFSYSGEYLPLSLTMAEIILFGFLIIFIYLKVIKRKIYNIKKKWIFEHISFGSKGFLSGALLGLNTRIDILTIGYFLSDKIVGIYSFSSILAEGISTIPIVVRRNIDPLIGECVSKNNFLEIEDYSKKIKKLLPFSMLIIAVISSIIFKMVIDFLIKIPEFGQSFLIFVILMIGVVLNSIYRPFLGILLQSGKPGYHTLMTSMLVIFNIIGNIILIPIFGIYGAAYVTAFVYLSEGLLIKYFSKKILKINL